MPHFISSSKGNRFTISQSHDKVDSSTVPIQLTDAEIISLLTSTKAIDCCSKANCLVSSFVTKTGSTDFNESVIFFRNCREFTRTKDKQERSLFLLQEYKKCIVSDKTSNRFTSVWKLPNDIVVCRNSWAIAYDFTMYELDYCSTKLKKNKDSVKLSSSAFTDRSLHPFTYNETMEMMDENFLHPGKLYFAE